MTRLPWSDIPDARRAVMRSNKGKDTKPEVAVRRLLHAMGYRFRLHRRDLPGTPDIVLPGRRTPIQGPGGFGHQHAVGRQGRIPATRRDYWMPKLARNKERDEQASTALAGLGWQCATVWECELADMGQLAARMALFLGQPGKHPTAGNVSRSVRRKPVSPLGEPA